MLCAAAGQIGLDSAEHCYFTTNDGYIGQASHEVRADDVLYLLYGCAVPAVLRANANCAFELVAFAYVDGLSNFQYGVDRQLWSHRLSEFQEIELQ
jgi:hypothetical protein